MFSWFISVKHLKITTMVKNYTVNIQLCFQQKARPLVNIVTFVQNVYVTDSLLEYHCTTLLKNEWSQRRLGGKSVVSYIIFTQHRMATHKIIKVTTRWSLCCINIPFFSTPATSVKKRVKFSSIPTLKKKRIHNCCFDFYILQWSHLQMHPFGFHNQLNTTTKTQVMHTQPTNSKVKQTENNAATSK